MAEPDDLDVAACEYVLGLLDVGERRTFARRLAREPLAVVTVRDWQERLAPLALALPPIQPPSTLFRRIEASIAGAAASAAVNDNRVVRWRWATAAATIVAVIAAGLALRAPPAPPVAPVPVEPARFAGGLAALSSGGGEPALLVTVDRRTHRLRVLPVNLPDDTKHSLELWAIRGNAAPVAKGLIDPRRSHDQGTLEALGNVVLAVSREPLGGSPTGQPSGPVLFTGKLVSIPAT